MPVSPSEALLPSLQQKFHHVIFQISHNWNENRWHFIIYVKITPYCHNEPIKRAYRRFVLNYVQRIGFITVQTKCIELSAKTVS
jgi:hypothetical protein